MSLQDLLKRLNEPSSKPQENQATLEQLKGLLAQDDEKGLCRAQAIDAQVDRLLCWRISCSIPQLTSNQLDRASLRITLECLTILWTKTSTTERRRETRRQGIELCDGLLLLWETFPEDETIVSPISLILKSWTKLFPTDSSVRESLIRQSNLVSFCRRQLERETSSTQKSTGLLNIMKHVVFRADAQQKEFLYEQWKDVVIRAIQVPPTSHTRDVQPCAEYVSAILWNWATCPQVARTMASSSEMWICLDILLQNALENRDVTVQRNAVSAVGTIISFFGESSKHQDRGEAADSAADDQENEPREPPDVLQNQKWIIRSLIEVIHTTSDSDSKRRCLRTVRCLSSSPWGRAYLSRNNPKDEKPLLPLLLQVLRRPERDVNIHVQICQTVVSLAPSFTEDWVQAWISHMEVALMQKVQDPTTEKGLVLAALSAISVCIGASASDQSLGWDATEFYRQLAQLLEKYKNDGTFYHRTADLMNRIVRHDCETYREATHGSSESMVDEHNGEDAEEEGSCCLASNSHILEILCLLLSPASSNSCSAAELEHSHQATADTLKYLVNHPDSRNKKALADHEELLTALVNLCLVIPVGSTKTEAKQIILALVPEL